MTTATYAARPTIIHKLTPARAHDWATCGGFFAASHLGVMRRPQTYACLLGTAVHELIAACERRGAGQPLDSEAILRAHWRPGRFALAEDAGAREEARPLLATYLARRARERVEVLASETFLETQPRKAGSGYSIALSGRLDRVARRPDGTIEVLDYKTGTLPTPDELRRDPASVIYHLLATEHYDVPAVVITQMSLRTGATVDVALGPNDIEAGKEQLREMARQLQTGAFSLTPSGACAYCPAREGCPALRNAEHTVDTAF